MISPNGAFGEVVFGHVSHPILMLVGLHLPNHSLQELKYYDFIMTISFNEL
jgi:hypothetical protein